ncbi:MAG TPA: winged helix DNA-binding domain-containing protein [Chloroflexota bacterium]|nr:winged helix DNA-binding domain-containing protein [Chloroflexota bacterium]
MLGAQAQDAPAGTLSLRPRLDPTKGFTAADVETARVHDRTVVRLTLMRGTIHLVAAEDLPLLLPLCGAEYERGFTKRRLELGLDTATAQRGLKLLDRLLAEHGPLSREQLRAHLSKHRIPTDGQSLAHLLYLARGPRAVCHGPGQGARQTFVRLQDWLPQPVLENLAKPPPRAAALRTLVRRYLEAFAPATPEDCAAWSGLRISEIRTAWAALAADLIELDTPHRPRFILKEQREWLDEPLPKRPHVRLLASFDTLLMGYVATRGARDLTVDPRYAPRVLPGGGMLRPTLSVDGHLQATWRPDRKHNRLHITLTPFEPLPKHVLRAAEQDAQDVARYLGLEEATLA